MGKLSGKKIPMKIKLGSKTVEVHRDAPTSVATLVTKKPNWGAMKMKLCDTCAKTHGGFTDEAYKSYMVECQKMGGRADKAALWLTSTSGRVNNRDAVASAVKKTKVLMKKNPDGAFKKLVDAVVTPGVTHVQRKKAGRKVKNARTIKSPARPYDF